MTTDLLTLVHWLSPAYPVGAFSYSHGLERSVEQGVVRDAATFDAWLRDILELGAGRADAVLLACAYRAGDADELAETDALARALSPSRERAMETTLQGEAFARTTAAIWGGDAVALTYPVAVGAAAAAQDLPLGAVLEIFVHAFAANLTSAAIRLVPLGQTEAHTVLAGVAPLCRQIAREAETAGLDDLGSCVFLADIASMQHETMYSRLFRS
ncbi:MAG: urease accessory protein UreF [Rhodobacteraceae bacterium]|nr:urease accessory protein UreF [Paracoccaceae bacterium]